MGSQKFKLDQTDLTKIGKGALVAIGGALVAYLATVIAHLDQSTVQGALIAAVGGVLINAARKWLNDNTEKNEEKNET